MNLQQLEILPAHLDGLNDILYISDRNGIVLEICGLWLKKNGLNSSELLHKSIEEIFAQYNNIHSSPLVRCLNGEAVLYEWDYTDKDGNTVHFQTSLSRIEHNNEFLAAGIIRNITRQKAVDSFYRELELSFRSITNAASYAIISLNENKVVEYSNPAASFIFGYSEEELLGLEIGQLFDSPFEFYDIIQKHIKSVVFHKRPIEANITYELISVKKDGDIIPVELNVSSYEVFKINHIVLIISDISERKKTEMKLLESRSILKDKNRDLESALESLKSVQKQLIHSEKMASLGQLTAGIAHEINNPLAYVASNVNRFKEYFEDINLLFDQYKSFTKKIKNSGFDTELETLAEKEKEIDIEFLRNDFSDLMKNNEEGLNRIKNIVQQLRGFSYSASAVFSPEDINLALEETLTLIWNEVKYKAEVIKNFGPIPRAECNISEIKQVFVNLLVNAAYAIEAQGKILIETSAEDMFVSVKIEDTGAGIAENILDKIFDPFFTTKPIGKGTGLGLWICDSIIRKHNGSIKVKSEIGKGTSFIVRIPIKQKQSKRVI